jgi:hypothetical protein
VVVEETKVAEVVLVAIEQLSQVLIVMLELFLYQHKDIQ